MLPRTEARLSQAWQGNSRYTKAEEILPSLCTWNNVGVMPAVTITAYAKGSTGYVKDTPERWAQAGMRTGEGMKELTKNAKC
jgi:hypothetical protein